MVNRESDRRQDEEIVKKRGYQIQTDDILK